MGLLRLRPLRALALAAAFCFFVLSGCGDPGSADVADGQRVIEPTPTSEPASESPADEPAVDASDTVADASIDDGEDPVAEEPEPTSAPEPTATTVPTPEPTAVVRPQAPNGRTAPVVATSAIGLAEQLIAAEAGLNDPASTAAQRADWGHLHQVAIRKLGYSPEWDVDVFETLPQDLRPRTLLHVSARRALIMLLAIIGPRSGAVEPAS